MISLHIDGDTPSEFLKQLSTVAAALLGASAGAISISGAGKIDVPAAPPKAVAQPEPAKPVDAPASEEAPAGEAGTGEVDAGGHPWSADLHASTKGTTKEGYWRMKVSVSRPANLPGFPKSDGGTGTANAGETSSAPATVASAVAGPVEEEDEFSQFRAIADKSNEADAAAAASVPARTWTDADLGALCNQAAVKLGDPAPVKEIIEQFAAPGETPHSRNIPDDKREAFAQAVEAKAEITFAG